MHYWFVEAESDAGDNSPLILWFNGGPGASSLYGLLVELGPFILNDISLEGPEYAATGIPRLIYNEYGWQKAGNILALSMPPPVGFSYCTPPGPQATGDDCGAWNDTSTAEVMRIHTVLLFFSDQKDIIFICVIE
jgi:carboxypeptidase C (cathepsin A)